LSGAYTTHGEMRKKTKFLSENLKGRDNLEDLGMDGADLREMGWEYVEWIHLSQNRDQLWVLVIVVMNFQVIEKARNFLTN
jgi:hypothetical protein